jgi:hypothetical protein
VRGERRSIEVEGEEGEACVCVRIGGGDIGIESGGEGRRGGRILDNEVAGSGSDGTWVGEQEGDEQFVRSKLSIFAGWDFGKRGDVRRGSAMIRAFRAGLAVQLESVVVGTGDELRELGFVINVD